MRNNGYYVVLLLLFILVGTSENLFAQQQQDPYLAFAEQMPQPIGGMEAIYKNIHYPETAREAHLEGKVYLLLYINENGTIDKMTVIKGIGLGCDKAAEDGVGKVKFTPAKNNGVAVKVKLSLAITFKLSG